MAADPALLALLGVGREPSGRSHRARPAPPPPRPSELVVSCSHALCGARFASLIDAERHMQKHSVHVRCLYAHCFDNASAECQLCASYIERNIITPERMTRLIQSPRIGEAVDVEARRSLGMFADDRRLSIECRAGRNSATLLGMDDRPLDIPVVAAPAETGE